MEMGVFADFVDEDFGEGVADAGVCACYDCCWHGGCDGDLSVSPCETSI